MNQSEPICPPEVLDWIAWYPDQGLSESERGAVEAHAAGCSACRREIDVVAGRFELPPEVDAERIFARVLARIESENLGAPRAAAAREAVGSPSEDEAAAHRRVRPARWTMGAARWAAGVAFALLFTGLGWVAATSRAPGDRAYHTAAEPPAASAPASAALDLVFRSDASADRINTELRGLGAAIVSGPSQLGRYRIALPAGSDTSAAAALLRAEGTGVASFAEPVRP
jgi:hypothetical protein